MDFAKRKNFIVAVDIGTTNLKCYLYSKNMSRIHRTSEKICVVHSCDGAAEIIPDHLWNSVVSNVKKLLFEANISSAEVACLAISTQRCTFTSWNRHSGQLLLNLITWKDQRAAEEIRKWNRSWTFKVTMRLLWALRNYTALKTAIKNSSAMFGTLDTWLIYRLTGGKSYRSDYSCASATGMYDPFTFSWTFLLKLLGIPDSILAAVCDSAGTHFGNVSSDIWGSEIPITCSVADQAASAFGLLCSNCGDVKLTLGTGGFMSSTTGREICSNRKENIYPLIYWKYGNIQACVLESGFSNCGTLVDWAYHAGYFDKVEDLSVLAESVVDSNGVYLKIGFFESEIRGKCDVLETAFVGATVVTKKVHLIRAILESIIFQVYWLHLSFRSEAYFDKRSMIRVNGGVSNNDFVCQSIANICDVMVKRPHCVEASIRGAALLAGKAAGLWSEDDIDETNGRIFYPNEQSGQVLRSKYLVWAQYQT